MKTFNLSVAVIIMLAFLLIQEGCTFSTDNGDPDQHAVDASTGRAVDILEDQWKMPDSNREKRHSGPCRFCCNCCGRMNFCGLCCEWRF
nr:antimicrobial peptide hepcidin type II [Syngnathus schlegeli]